MSEHEAHPVTTALNTAAIRNNRDVYPLSAEDEAAISTLPEGWALLICTNSELRGARYLLDVKQEDGGAVHEIVAGRSPNSDIFLDDVTVSRSHAIFTPNAGTFVLTDHNSLNGTYINGDRIDSIPLQNGVEVQIGKFQFVFVLGTGK